MNLQDKKFVIRFVKHTISEFVKKNKVSEIPKKHPASLDRKCGVFVTLNENRELRGCVGFCGTGRKIIENLRDASIESCLDSRFLPVTCDELPHIGFEVSVLTEPILINAECPESLLKKIAPKDGLVIECYGRSGLFLPQVWDEVPEKEDFLMHLCFKAGVPEDAWKNGARIYKFNAEIIAGKF